MLFTKSIIKPRCAEEGIRISVMSRHTLGDGVTPDPRITQNSYDRWLRELAPPDRLVGDYYKKGLSWEEYEKRYLNFLRQEVIKSKVHELARNALDEDITILCIEEKPTYCHRRLLAEECQRYQPCLRIEHR